jgi:hypothetical protein
MKWNKPIVHFVAALLIGSYMDVAIADSCDDLKVYFKKSDSKHPESQSKLLKLQMLMNEDSLCAKNLFGQLEFEGKHVAPSPTNAKNIFADLSNKNYPPAMFNLAFVLSKEKNSDPEVVTTILLGVYGTYVNDRKYSDLAHKASDYGRSYIKTLEEPEKTITKQKFESALSDINLSTTSQVYERVRRSNEIVENFGNVLLVGAALYVGARVGSAVVSSARSTTYIQNNIINYSPSPSLYQIYSPGGGQLYAIPLR